MNEPEADNRHVGIGLSRFGQTWWGKQWLRTLEQLGLRYPDGRLPKARTLVRNGDVDLMHLEPGELSAWVDQPRRSFEVALRLPVFTDEQWQRFNAVMASQWRNLVELREDRLPSDVDRQLEGVGLSLFPGDGELTTWCPCRDRSPVCVHVIALQHAFTVWFDDDPFLLTRLRGRDRESLLNAIREGTAAQPVSAGELQTVPLPTDSDFFTGGAGLSELERIAGYGGAVQK